MPCLDVLKLTCHEYVAACDPEVAKKLTNELEQAEAAASKVRLPGTCHTQYNHALCQSSMNEELLRDMQQPWGLLQSAGRQEQQHKSLQVIALPATHNVDCWVLQNLVLQKQPLTKAALESAIDNIRGAVMICYPAGLPEWDFVRQCLELREDLTGTNVSSCRNSKTSSLVWQSVEHVTFQPVQPAALRSSPWQLAGVSSC